MEKDVTTDTSTNKEERIGARLLADVQKLPETDGYQANGLPSLDETIHSDEDISKLQTRALKLQS